MLIWILISVVGITVSVSLWNWHVNRSFKNKTFNGYHAKRRQRELDRILQPDENRLDNDKKEKL